MNSEATGPTVPFSRKIYRRFELPRHLGEVISGWDDPEMIEGTEATHMRADDYVIGLVVDGCARAYPLWIVDHYHIVNDQLGDNRFVVASCERCQTGGAFVAEVDGNAARAPLFRGVGFMNATLLMRDLRTGSFWNHSVARCISGRVEGDMLPWLPTFHIEWGDWLETHPDTLVMTAPDDPTHPDARHGHGRDEFFSRPGMEPVFVPTITGRLDTTYPENEMVLCLGRDEKPYAYPLREVQKEGGVVHAQRGPDRIAVFAGPAADGFTMAAYVARNKDRDLTFSRGDGLFVDAETQSSWNIEGACVSGPLVNNRLDPVSWFYMRWHAWIYNHRDTQIFESKYEPELFDPASGAERTEVGDLGPLLTWFSSRTEVRVEGELVSQLRPRESLRSLVAYIDGHRVKFHRFTSEEAAGDFDSLAAAWTGFPLKPKNLESQTRRVGTVVIESDPENRFVDPLSIVPQAEDVVSWPPVLEEPIDPGVVDAPDESVAPRPGFTRVIRELRRRGIEVLEVAFATPAQLRPHCENAIALTLEGDRFLLYRFEDISSAEGFSQQVGHAIRAGEFVLRSVPATMYEHQGAEILYVGEEHTRWSPLLSDERISDALDALVMPH